jgi:hypothetical protein
MHPIIVRSLAAAAAVAVIALAWGGVASAATPDAKLLKTYQPVTRFDPSERFRPTSVQSFVADSDLERFDGSSWAVVDADPEPGALPGPGTGVWRLNQDSCVPTATLGGVECYGAAWDAGSGGSAVYGRVVRTASAVVLQYWYFYYDNTYSYFYPPRDAIWQAHEGDWEVVNVVLSADGTPREVAYSQHCLGERRAWVDTPRIDEMHPVVYVAAGSHAGYFSPGRHPFDVRCVPPQALALLGQLGLPPPDDVTGNGDVEGPPQTGGRVSTIRNADEAAKQWLSFPGFWGELQYFHAPVVGTVPFGTSPLGPAFHRAWDDPLGTIGGWTQT